MVIEPQERPPPPDGPHLVVGLGKAGAAAAQALLKVAPAAAVRAWTGYESAAERGARERLRERGVSVSVGEQAAAGELERGPACIVKSPGIPMSHFLLAGARDSRIPVIDELELGWRLGAAPVIGVTGTDGKGTVTHLIAHCLRAAGKAAACTGNRLVEPAYSAIEEPKRGWLVCEASSYQLEASPGFLPEVGVLTNLSHEHLHRHGDMDGYADCKRRMFVRDDRCVRLAVVHGDDPFGAGLARDVSRRGGRAITFGARDQADYRVLSADWTLGSGEADVATLEGAVRLRSRLAGEHNVLNLLAALATVEALAVPREAALEALAEAEPVPGRLELISEGQPFNALVDFAHTPAAVARTLETIRRVLDRRGSGRLVAVVGVVGGSDPSKRPLIGATAHRMSEVVVFTSGAPGAERREAIATALAEGARSTSGGAFEVEPDRRAAIERAVELARPDDVLVVLGRGSMPRMRISREGDEVDFDDRDVLRTAIREAGPLSARVADRR